jgi:hypothetical protein
MRAMNENFAVGDAAYAAEHALVGRGRRKILTRDGIVMIIGDELAVLAPGDEPVQDRILLAAHVNDVEVIGRPWHGLGQSVNLRIDGQLWAIQPESVSQGTGMATPKKMRRAREAAIALETALAETQRATAQDPSARRNVAN